MHAGWPWPLAAWPDGIDAAELLKTFSKEGR